MADREFDRLQQRLRALWPSVTLRSIGDVERTVVVVHSISMDVPDQLIPVFPAYEERFLCLVLSLLRSRNSRSTASSAVACPAGRPSCSPNERNGASGTFVIFMRASIGAVSGMSGVLLPAA